MDTNKTGYYPDFIPDSTCGHGFTPPIADIIAMKGVNYGEQKQAYLY